MPSTHVASSLSAVALVLASAGHLSAQASSGAVPPADAQIAAAVLAAPQADRAGATVLGFRPDGSLAKLREGTNELICLGDDPNAEGWSVACYHESLEPFMARGRQLRARGITDAAEVTRRRWAEADAGTLAMPETPAALYVLTGDGYDPAADEVANPYLRWVIYTPWATAESTGLSTQPGAPGAPWLMFPGTAGAHIMIMPGRADAGN